MLIALRQWFSIHFFGAFLLVVFLIRALESFVFFAHGDALYYHLPHARLIFERGFDWTYLNLCGAITTGLFDYIYLLSVGLSPNLWMGQLTSQLLHYLASIALSAGFVYYYFKEDRKFASVAGLGMLTISLGASFFYFAKNDGALASVALITAGYFSRQKSNTNPLIAGLLLGLMPAIKMNGLFATMPLALIYCWDQRNKPLNIIWAGITAFAIWSPFLWRNYHYYGNPFFPGLIDLFPGKISEPIKENYKSFMQNPLNMNAFVMLLKIFFMPKLVVLGAFLLIQKTTFKKHWRIIVTTVANFVLYAVMNGGYPDYRFLFPVMFLNVFLFFLLLRDHPIYARKRMLILWLVFVAVLVDSKIDKSVKRVRTLGDQFHALQTEPDEYIKVKSMSTRVWETMPYQDELKILSDGFIEVYYAPPKTTLHCTLCNNEAAFLASCNKEGQLEELKQYNYAILMKSKMGANSNNPCYQEITSKKSVYSDETFEVFQL